MAKDLTAVLWNLGYDAALAQKVGRPYFFSESNKGLGKRQYQVMVPSGEAKRFVAEIGFLEERKNAVVRAATTRESAFAHRSNSIPAQVLLRVSEQRETAVRRALRVQRAKGSSRISLVLVRKYFRQELAGHPILTDAKLRFTAVHSVASGGRRPTFDVSVSTSHEYVANSVVVHNTLKYNPKKVDFEQFTGMMLQYQSTVRCCSVMAQDDDYSAYAYVPEERINAAQYAELMSKIDSVQVEAYDEDALSCAGGACPIERNI
jgi:hypothetical protein